MDLGCKQGHPRRRRSWRSWALGSSRASAARPARSAHDSLGTPALRWNYGDLMAQDKDLGVLSAVGAAEQRKPAEHAEDSQVSES
jgi:hypothetical protein